MPLRALDDRRRDAPHYSAVDASASTPAWVFVITYRDSRKVAGAALVVLAARYTTVCYCNAARLDRRLASAAQWKQIREAFVMGLPTTPLPSAEVLPQVLLGDHGIDVQLQWVTTKDVDIEVREHSVSLLDDLLLRQCAALKATTDCAG